MIDFKMRMKHISFRSTNLTPDFLEFGHLIFPVMKSDIKRMFRCTRTGKGGPLSFDACTLNIIMLSTVTIL